MYGASSTFKNAIKGRSREITWRGTITLTDGTPYPLTTANIVQGTGTISRSCSSDSSINLGGVYASELQIQLKLDINRYLLPDATITLVSGLVYEENQTTEEVPIGTFTISEALRAVGSIKVTAYDNMLKFEKTLPSMDAMPRTPYTWLRWICTNCGVALGMGESAITSLPNGTRSLAYTDTGNVSTYRDLLSELSIVLGTVATINRTGALVLLQYGTSPVDEIGTSFRYSSDFSDYQSYYTGMYATYNDSGKAEYFKATGISVDDGLVLNIGANPFLQIVNDSTRKAAAQAVIDSVAGRRYTPFNVIIPFNPLYDLMDVIKFTGGQSSSGDIAPITSISYKINGQMTIQCGGENPELIDTQSQESKAISNLSSQLSYQSSLLSSTEQRSYDYVNEETAISVTDGADRVKLVEIEYEAGKSARVEFRAEVKMTVTTTESSATEGGVTTYTENDAVVRVYYRDIGEWMTDYYPVDTFTDGVKLLHLYYFWDAPYYSQDERVFQAWIECAGAALSIAAGDVHATIETSGALTGPRSLLYVTITEYPENTEYLTGETLDYTGLEVTASYTDGYEADVTSQCTISPADGTIVTEAGFMDVTVSYTEDGETYESSFYINVTHERNVESIAILTLPAKLNYQQGDMFDWTGLSVMAYYDDDTQEDISFFCTITPATYSTASVAGQNTVTVSYEDTSGSGDTFTDTFTANVAQIVRVEIAQLPTKTVYHAHEYYDWTGLQLNAVYDDDSTKDVTDIYTCAPANFDEVQYVKREWVDDPHTLICVPGIIDEWNHQSFYTQFAVQIYNTYVEELQLVSLPDKTEYEFGDLLDYTGIEVDALLSTGELIDVTDSCIFSPADGTEITTGGEINIGISYTGEGQYDYEVAYTADFDVNVTGGPFLRYVNYTINTTNRIITLTSLKPDVIVADNLQTLEIPDTYEYEGVTYQIYIQ